MLSSIYHNCRFYMTTLRNKSLTIANLMWSRFRKLKSDYKRKVHLDDSSLSGWKDFKLSNFLYRFKAESSFAQTSTMKRVGKFLSHLCWNQDKCAHHWWLYCHLVNFSETEKSLFRLPKSLRVKSLCSRTLSSGNSGCCHANGIESIDAPNHS